MPLYRFNRATRTPDDGDYDGDVYVRRAIAHPCLPIPPARVAALADEEQGIAGPYEIPPQVCIAAAMASEWTLNASFSDGYTTFTAVDEVFTFSATQSLGDRSQTSGAGAVCEYTDTQTGANGSSLQLNVSIGSLIRMKWTPDDDGLWWPGLIISILGVAYDSGSVEVHRVDWNLGSSVDTPVVTGGPALTVAGESFTLRLAGDNVSVTGTITLEPTDWLPRA